MKNIVFLDSHTLNPGDLKWDKMQNLGNLSVYPRSSKSEAIERAKTAHIIVTNKVLIDKDFIDACPNLEYICVAATGYNNIDVEAARAKGIPVSNVAGYSSTAVAQHVFANILAFCNQVSKYNQSVQNGDWYTSKDWTYWDRPIQEVAGLNLGIYGFGKIGQQVARIARAFDLNILVKHTRKLDGWPEIQWVDETELFSTSDFITLHVPLNNVTKGLINQNSLSKMKPSAFLINTGRGGLIQEKELRDALLNRQIAGAALDVLIEEPPKVNHPLIGLANCMITPHQAWAAQSSRKRLLAGLIKNIQSFLSGEVLNAVN